MAELSCHATFLRALPPPRPLNPPASAVGLNEHHTSHLCDICCLLAWPRFVKNVMNAVTEAAAIVRGAHCEGHGCCGTGCLKMGVV